MKKISIIVLIVVVLLVVGGLFVFGSKDEAKQVVSNQTVESTVEPTTEPTVEPTTEPTAEPTVEPTAEPTVEPTVEPTAEPTVEPTTEPDTTVQSETQTPATEQTQPSTNTSTQKPVTNDKYPAGSVASQASDEQIQAAIDLMRSEGFTEAEIAQYLFSTGNEGSNAVNRGDVSGDMTDVSDIPEDVLQKLQGMTTH